MIDVRRQALQQLGSYGMNGSFIGPSAAATGTREHGTGESDTTAARRYRALIRSVWIVVVVAFIVKSLVAPTKHTTYPVYEAAGVCWRAGTNMYSVEICGEDYRYSPTFAALIAPLSALPAWFGGMLWNLANVGVVAWSLSQFVRFIVPDHWTVQQRTTFMILAMAGVGRTLWAGQTNAMIGAFAVCGAAAIIRGRWWSAAFLLLAPAYIKIWPGACALVFACCEPRRLAGRCTAAGIAFAVVPFLLKPPAVALSFYRGWYAGLTGPFQHRHEYHDLWSVWEALAPPVEPHAYRIVGMTVALLVVLTCQWRGGFRSGVRPWAMLTLGLWMCWQLILGPGCERNTYSLIAPLTSWAVVDSFAAGRRRWWACACYAVMTGFSYGGLASLFSGVIPRTGDALPVATAAFAGLLLAALRDDRRIPAPYVVIPPESLGNAVPSRREPPVLLRLRAA
jgi:hypothetical protein